MKTFDDIMNTNVEDIEDAPLVPTGTYLVLVKGQPEKATARTGTEGWALKFTPIEALPDVDKSELDAVGGLQALELEHTFWITEKTAGMFRNFLKDACELTGMPASQAIMETAGKQLKVHVSHRPTDRRDGTKGLRPELDTFLRA